MLLDVRPLLRTPGKRLDFQFELDLSDVEFAGRYPVSRPVVVEGEATLKRVYYYPEEQKLVLEAENPAYDPLVFIGPDLETVHILGRAVAFQSKLR